MPKRKKGPDASARDRAEVRAGTGSARDKREVAAARKKKKKKKK